MSAIENDCIQLGQVSVLEFLIDELLTSVHEENALENHNVTIFPNPTEALVYIDIKSSNFDVTVLDNKGLTIELFDNQFDNALIDFNNYNSGIYFLRINNKSKNIVTTHKIIKN